MREDGLFKYPSTPHLEGSRLQKGDDESSRLVLANMVGQHAVLEEKMDGANCGISFSSTAQLQLQSRGHFLTGGASERQFNLLKPWAACHEEALFDVLEDRYVMFGEWMFAKHSMFYDALPHFFLEFDVYDKQQKIFLSTPRRQALLASAPVVSVPVLHAGPLPHALDRWVGPSVGRGSDWQESLREEAEHRRLDVERVVSQTDGDGRSEGLYLKFEDSDCVLARAKFVRSSFTQTILDGDGHWNRRPTIANRLRSGVDIFSPEVDNRWPPFETAVSPSARPLRGRNR